MSIDQRIAECHAARDQHLYAMELEEQTISVLEGIKHERMMRRVRRHMAGEHLDPPLNSSERFEVECLEIRQATEAKHAAWRAERLRLVAMGPTQARWDDLHRGM